MRLRHASIALAIIGAAAVCGSPGVSAAGDPAGGTTCGLDWNESEYRSGYLEPITGRKNISCEDAQRVAEAARKATNYRLYCAKKSRYRKWTIRHVGYAESLSARFTKGSQRFRIQSQGSCK